MKIQPTPPAGKIVKFGDVVRNANLTERDPTSAGIDRIVGLEHIDPENLHIRRWDSPENNASFTRKFVPGQTLFGKRRAYQRKVAFAEFKGICSGDILTFEPINHNVLLPELLPFICQTNKFFDYALGTSAGSLSPRTSWSALKEFEFPLPPIDEQKRIAEILWAADEAVEKWLCSYRALLAIDNKLSEELLEGEGSSRNLGHFIEIISGQHIQASDYTSNPPGVPYLTGPADFPDGEIIVTKYTESPKAMCSKGDILVTCKGSGTGKSIEADQAYCISRQLMAVRPKSINQLLLKKILAAFSGQFNIEAKGLIPGISRSDILDKQVYLPDDSQIKVIEGKILAIERSKDNMKSHIDNFILLRKKLLNECVTGEIGHV